MKKLSRKHKIKIIFKKLILFFRTVSIFVIDFLYPHRCPSCKKIVELDSVFCLNCWKKLQFITKPICNVCGTPLQFNTFLDENIMCTRCLLKKPYYDKAVSCFVYNKTISRAIFEFKFYQKTFLSKLFAKFIYRSTEKYLKDIDYIIPVPMSLKRLRWRGFNQALLLARRLGELSKKEVIPNLIIKTKHTKAQVKLKNKDRVKNLKSVFVVNDDYLEKIKGKNIAIIDDVITTGTTVNECSKVLKKCNVGTIFIFSIAKTSFMRKDNGDSYGI